MMFRILKYESHPASDHGQIVVGDVQTKNPDLMICSQDPVQVKQKGRFSSPVRADKTDRLAFKDMQIKMGKRPGAIGVYIIQVFDFNGVTGHVSGLPIGSRPERPS